MLTTKSHTKDRLAITIQADLESEEVWAAPPVIEKLERFEFLFKWVRFFYPKAKGVRTPYLLYFFFPQKILRINGKIPWPVHFTSRVLYYKNIEVGNRCDLGYNAGCYIQGRNGIKAGHNVRVGPGVGILSVGHNIDDYDLWDKSDPIIIGSNVWIGMNATILPSVKIGDNVIISANSVVSRDIPSDSIAAGNPCRVIMKKEPYKGKDYSRID